MTLFQRFFESTNGMDPCTEADYMKLAAYFNPLESLSMATSTSRYVIDFYKRTFDYVSDNGLFLAGYSAEQVKNRGFSHFEETVPPEDLKMMVEISCKAFEVLYRLPVESRPFCSLSYDFRMKQPEGPPLLLHHIIVPMNFTHEHYLWLALCQVDLSVKRQPGNVIFTQQKENKKLEYSFLCQKFKSYEDIPLTKREKEILGYMKSGLTDHEIACAIVIEPDTVKFHKKNLYHKLGVTNSRQAIFYSTMRGMI
jgi:DNA-binding CsgD family transcriptional regulator